MNELENYKLIAHYGLLLQKQLIYSILNLKN